MPKKGSRKNAKGAGAGSNSSKGSRSSKSSRSSKGSKGSRKSSTRKALKLPGNLNNAPWGNVMMADEMGLKGEKRTAFLKKAASNEKKTRTRRAARNANTEKKKQAARNEYEAGKGNRRASRGARLPWHTPSPNNASNGRRNTRRRSPPAAKPKPRKGKVMRQCRADETGCERHMKTGDCKFVHRDEPEFAMLRADQKL